MAEIVLTEWQSTVVTLTAPDVRYLTELVTRYHAAVLTLTPRGGDDYLW